MTAPRLGTIIEPPGPVKMLGLSGSRMFGLATADSDEDWRGVYQAPTSTLVGVHPVPERAWERKPDVVLWELGHFCRLLLKGNPNIIEMLWMPEDVTFLEPSYEVALLVAMREKFITQRMVRAYLGWVYGELRAPNLTPKRAHHIPRLLLEVTSALNGAFTVRPERDQHAYLMQAKAGDLPVSEVLLDAREVLGSLETDPRVKALPDEGPEQEVERILLDARHRLW